MVVNYLQPLFPDARREPLRSNADIGDIGGIADLVVQVKVVREMALAGWVDAAAKQADRKGVPHYVVVHKRRGRGNPGEWYATLPLKVFAALYAEVLAPHVNVR